MVVEGVVAMTVHGTAPSFEETLCDVWTALSQAATRDEEAAAFLEMFERWAEAWIRERLNS